MQYHKYILLCSLQSFIYKQTRKYITHKYEWDKELERIPDTLNDRFQIPKVSIWTINGENEARGQASSLGVGGEVYAMNTGRQMIPRYFPAAC